MTVEGVVTTKPGLLDSSGERVTIQDASAAVLLRLPASTSVSVGQKVRVSGAMGTYYGAPQLTATSLAAQGQGSATAADVGSAPIAAGLEWRLVTVSGTVDNVQRDGDSWKAEIAVNGGSIPITGIDRSGISSTALVEGRTATVTGIVKRAYPTATDQRLAVVPRSAADIRLGSGGSAASPGPSGSPRPIASGTAHASSRPPTGNGAGAASSGHPGATNGPAATGGEPGPTGSAQASFVVISALAEHEGETVRIGGRIASVSGSTVTVDDGTGVAAVRLSEQAAALANDLRPTDLVNITGMVGRTAAGGIEIVVDNPANVTRIPAPASLAAASSTQESPAEAVAGGATGDEDVPPTSGVSIEIVALAGLLAMISVALIALAAAGPRRRARLIAALEPIREKLRKLTLRSA